MTEYTERELTIETSGGPLVCLLREPQRLSPSPSTFLCFFGSAQESLDHETALRALEGGHRTLSFDLPCHGRRAEDTGEGAQGLCAAFLAMEDPFLQLVSDARSLMDAAEPFSRGYFAVGGHLGGYMALRLMAREPRILAAAALSPVSDFTVLDEWREVADLQAVEELSLRLYAGGLAGKPLYLSVNSHDRRVGARQVCGLFCAVYDENERRGYDNGLLDFRCDGKDDHAVAAAQFLLGLAAL